MPIAAANYTHYPTITGCRVSTFPTHRCLRVEIPSSTRSLLLLLRDVTQGLVSERDTLELLISPALHIYLSCDPSLRSALAHYGQKEVNHS